MTTIIAVENSDHVLIGCDSQVTSGAEKTSLTGGKIVTNGEYTIAVAGRLRMLQAIQYAKLPMVPIGISGSQLDEFVSTKLGPAVAKAEKKFDCEGQSLYIFVIRGRVYNVAGDGCFIRSQENVYSIGSGSSYALGSLLGVDGEPAASDVLTALGVASMQDIYTRGPFNIRKV